MELGRAGLNGNNGKSAERMVAKSTNRSRNDSVLCLRLPHNPEVGGSSPPSATTKTAVFYMKTAVFIAFWESPILDSSE